VVRNLEEEGTDKEVRIYTKGAPDMLFEKLAGVLGEDEAVLGIDDDCELPIELGGGSDMHLGLLEKTVKNFADRAYRTLLICYRDMSMEQYEELKAANNDFETEADREVLEDELVAVGIFGLQDPLRPSIVDSIKQCQTAGITVLMCTGDNIDTAIAISKNAGIINA